jgi:7-cyano-7-deazaguanine synthase
VKVVVLFSGGLDSTVLLWQLLTEGSIVYPLAVDYGQRNKVELASANQIIAIARSTFEGKVAGYETIDLSSIRPLLSGCSLTDNSVDVAHGYYADEGSMRTNVVPNRNMMLLALAAAWAIGLNADAIAYAVHAHVVDHSTYLDCLPAFVDAMHGPLALVRHKPIELLTPFQDKTKAGLVRLGLDLNAPLSLTYSCYAGAPLHCGRCGTCTERVEAFQVANVLDPTSYVL